ncbi:alpha/beta hydrolase [Lentilactobacillus sp. Marseille-Q4993]|uniref:alpha/beta hydrolase n=1 Tax=Lentilactobacillus sp. Marseille-Q4993 TaxID=3039492 RepID=UPI0024BC0CD2|nr:alpha/beta hydrolase [Lentilactobacillus sp. Marseille-Q4993]
MSTRKKLLTSWAQILGLAFFTAVCFGGGEISSQAQSVNKPIKPVMYTVHKPVKAVPTTAKNEPIVFLHGFNGKYWSEKYLINSLAKHKHVRKGLKVYVDAGNRIKITGNYKQSATTHNTIAIIMKNNRAGDYVFTRQLNQAMNKLAKTYKFTRYSAVGHSMGAYTWVNFLETHPKFEKHAKIDRLVTISGAFNGVLRFNGPMSMATGNARYLFNDGYHINRFGRKGRPMIIHPEFKHLLKFRKNLPRGLKILNMYGDLGNGTRSDGVVTTVSAQSIRYLVKGLPIAYHQKRFMGYNAQHRMIHINNQPVKKSMAKFLLG